MSLSVLCTLVSLLYYGKHVLYFCMSSVSPSEHPIHSYSFPPSSSLCLSEPYMLWLMVRDALWGPTAKKTWPMSHQQHNNKPVTALLTFISISFSLLSIRVFFSLFRFLSFCLSAWPCFELQETLMCSDICDSGETLQFLSDHSLKSQLSGWLNGWWQSILSQLSGSDTVSGDQSPICNEHRMDKISGSYRLVMTDPPATWRKVQRFKHLKH